MLQGRQGCPYVDVDLLLRQQATRGRIVPKLIAIAKANELLLFRSKNDRDLDARIRLDTTNPKNRLILSRETQEIVM